MTDATHYEYGTETCAVRERGTVYLHDTPDETTVTTELDAAGFVQDDGAWRKRRRRPARDGDSGGLTVATVTLDDDRLRVNVRDVVGVVGLVPGTRLEIEPKVGWEPLVDMLLTVYDLDRSESYFGMPLSAVLDETVDATQLLALLAINYVDGVRAVRREGLVRDIQFRRRAGFEGAGSVDVAATLRNRVGGDSLTDGAAADYPRPVWVDTDVRYDAAPNAAVHRAGRVLLGLLSQMDADGPRLATLQSLVDRELRRLEDRGVDSSAREIPRYSRVTVGDLPRQRRYYRRALQVSRSILSGTLLGGGDDFLVDYAFGTQRLFQTYTQRVIESALSDLREVDALGLLDGVDCRDEPTLQAFHEEGFKHEPDHLLKDGDHAVAVFDSKYYAAGKNPLDDGRARSRLFAYGHITGADRLAVLTPGYSEKRYEHRAVPGGVAVVSPGDDHDFSCDSYVRAVRAYLSEVVTDAYPTFETLYDAARHHVVLHGRETDLSRIRELGGPFGTDDGIFAKRVFNGINFDDRFPDRTQLQDDGSRFVSRVEDVFKQTSPKGRRLFPRHRTTCVPVYRPDAPVEGGSDFGPNGAFGVVDLHLFTAVDAGDETDSHAAADQLTHEAPSAVADRTDGGPREWRRSVESVEVF